MNRTLTFETDINTGDNTKPPVNYSMGTANTSTLYQMNLN